MNWLLIWLSARTDWRLMTIIVYKKYDLSFGEKSFFFLVGFLVQEGANVGCRRGKKRSSGYDRLSFPSFFSLSLPLSPIIITSPRQRHRSTQLHKSHRHLPKQTERKRTKGTVSVSDLHLLTNLLLRQKHWEDDGQQTVGSFPISSAILELPLVPLM